jgi:hypothetical protein
MKQFWQVLALFLVAGMASATTVAPRRCTPDTKAVEWTAPKFPSTVNRRTVRSVVAYVAIDKEGSVTFARIIELELVPSGRSDSQESFDRALTAATASWRFPRQPGRCVMEFKLPVQVSRAWPNNSFKPKPLRGSA